LRGKHSPLAEHGSIFIDNGIEFDVDPRLVIAIAGAETTFGTNMGCNAVFNAWSWFWNDPINLVCPNQRLAVAPFLELKKSKRSFRTREALYFQ